MHAILGTLNSRKLIIKCSTNTTNETQQSVPLLHSIELVGYDISIHNGVKV